MCIRAVMAALTTVLWAIYAPSEAWSMVPPASNNCELILSQAPDMALAKAPPEIPKSENVKTDSAEVFKAGTVARDNELAALPDETYIFLADSQKRLIYSPRAVLPDGALTESSQYLATHRALFARLLELGPNPVRILSAGEFIIRNGRVSEINNQSGTFPGGRENLTYGIAKLRTNGLKVEPGTFFGDHSTDNAGPARTTGLPLHHATGQRYALYKLMYANDPLHKRLHDLDHRLAKSFPDPTRPGFFDRRRVKGGLAKLCDGKQPSKEYMRGLVFATGLVEILYIDGIAYSVHLLQDRPSELLEQAFQMIEDVLFRAGNGQKTIKKTF